MGVLPARHSRGSAKRRSSTLNELLQTALTSYTVQVTATTGALPSLYTASSLPSLSNFQEAYTAGGTSTSLFVSADNGQQAILGACSLAQHHSPLGQGCELPPPGP